MSAYRIAVGRMYFKRGQNVSLDEAKFGIMAILLIDFGFSMLNLL